jgi:AAA15 family ATPase/GTPase
MSHIKSLSIRNYRGIKSLDWTIGAERFIVLIGRGDSGKSTILSALQAVLSPSWNITFCDLDFYKQDLSNQIEIEVLVSDLPPELMKESKYGLFIENDFDSNVPANEYQIRIRLTVDDTLEPHWFVRARHGSDIEDKPISATDRALLAVNYIADYTDNQFSYNRQSPLYALAKSSLQNGDTIERIKSRLLREITSQANIDGLQALNAPLKDVMNIAAKLGLKLNDIHASVDIKESPYTGNSIALHDNDLPFRLNGKGSKRLLSIAIQSELTKAGGIVLIDELEQGLEPDRIITLVRHLKKTKNGQVFITTHSATILVEADWHNIFIVQDNKSDSVHYIHQMLMELDACRRTNPQAFFAKKLICCEGKTEVGYIRALDEWIFAKYGETLSSIGVSVVNTTGGNNMYTLPLKLNSLGYNVCIFADDDKDDELKEYKSAAVERKIEMFLCESGLCLEAQVIQDLPWPKLTDLINCPQENFPNKYIQIEDDLRAEVYDNELPVDEQKIVRMRIINLCLDENSKKHLHAWFKHIPGGEFLGTLVGTSLDEMGSCKTKNNIMNLISWCGVGTD